MVRIILFYFYFFYFFFFYFFFFWGGGGGGGGGVGAGGNHLRFSQNKIVCNDVAICDPVHNILISIRPR